MRCLVKAEESNASFGATRWTLIGQLHGDERQRRQALEVIATMYHGPVYAYLRKKGHRSEEASDLRQAFFTEVILGRGLLDGAAKEKGRLRSLILAALNRFGIDQHRRASARPEGAAVSLDGIEREEAIFAESRSSDPDDAFDQRLALQMFHQAIYECEHHYRETGKARNWEVFAARIVFPMLRNCKPVPLDQLAREFGFRDAPDVSQAVQNVKERARGILKDVVAQTTAGTDQDAEDEYREILRLLGWEGPG